MAHRLHALIEPLPPRTADDKVRQADDLYRVGCAALRRRLALDHPQASPAQLEALVLHHLRARGGPRCPEWARRATHWPSGEPIP